MPERDPRWLEGGVSARNPIRGIFFSSRASGITPRASNTTATGIDGTTAFFIAHLVSDRDKGKGDLRRKVTGLVEWEGQNQPEIELNYATVVMRRRRIQFDYMLEFAQPVRI
jgi:hypothetical protein